MRRVLWLKEDSNRRNNFALNEAGRCVFKVLEQNKNVVDKTLRVLRKELLKDKFVFKTKMVRRCVMTGRARWVFRKLGLSRMALKDLMHKGLLYSLTKSSW